MLTEDRRTGDDDGQRTPGYTISSSAFGSCELKIFITYIWQLYKLTSTIFFKLVNLVLVMRPLTVHMYFVGIV